MLTIVVVYVFYTYVFGSKKDVFIYYVTNKMVYKMFHNLTKPNLVFSEQFNVKSLQLLINKQIINNSHDWNIEILKINANEVIFNNTGEREEIIIVLDGEGGITIDGESMLIKKGNMIYVPRNTVRSVANIDNKVLIILFISL